MSELKAIRGGDIHDLVKFGDGSEIYHEDTLYYLKNAVDTVIEEKDRVIEFVKTITLKDIEIIKEKDKEIAELKDENRRLKHALWIANSKGGEINCRRG